MTSSGCTKEEIKHILITCHTFPCKSNLITTLAYRSLACSVFREVIFEVGTRCLNTDDFINNNNNNNVKYDQIPAGNEAMWIVAFQCFI